MGLLFSLAQPTGHSLHSREPLMSAAYHQVTKCSLRTADSAGAAEESKAWECRHTD